MEKIKEKRKEIEKEFNELLENKDINGEKLLKAVEKLYNKDQTNTKILLKYLTLKSNENKKELPSLLQKYSFFLSKEEIPLSNLDKYVNKKKSSMELFISFFEYIEKCNISNIAERIDFYHGIMMNENLEKGNINNYVSFENSELYIFTLYQKVIFNIIEKIETFSYKENEENPFIKEAKEKYNNWLIYKKIKENPKNLKELNETEREIYYKLQKENYQDINIEKIIDDLNNELSMLYHLSSNSFYKYFHMLSIFLKRIKKKFLEKFKDLDKSGNKEDFELFTYFCFFISHFDFSVITNFYVNLWLYSLNENENEINQILTKNSSTNGVKYIIKNDDLLLSVYDFENKSIHIYKVKSISNYVLQNIVDYLQYFTNENISDIMDSDKIDTSGFKISEIVINKYEIERYLKINKYQNELYIKLKWDVWKKFLIKIFTSQTIKDAFSALIKNLSIDFDFYNILTEKELEIIFEQIKFYQFPIKSKNSFTISPILQIYEYYKGFDSAYTEDKSKLISLIFYLLSNEHEIIENFNITIQNILFQKNIKLLNSKISDENIEQILFGKVIIDLTYKEMLFILDIDNYNYKCDEFRNKFSECNSKYIPSQSLKDFLNSLNIEFEPEEDSSTSYTINQNFLGKEAIFKKPLQHIYGSHYYSQELAYDHLEKLRNTMKIIINKKNNNK